MNIRSLITFIFTGIILLIVQVLFLKNLAVFGVAMGFLYLMFILDFSISVNRMNLLFVAFWVGLLIDIFYQTIGMHAASATLVAFIRPYWLKAISPTGGYDETSRPDLHEMGLSWYISYSFPLFFIYSFLFFSIDQWGTGGLLGVLNKSLFSTIFSMLLAILVQVLFFKRRRRI
ncbi:rod shape-determining protein MreD [Algoriphagus sp.]|uniref:rod shape-determining protein MreD n=1 Tax=Algoriphagus sp. TaxID=1872435 RepID=UPI00261D34AD|nr:rod shape-determining protein MreD [Algoriphagus sp.]